MLARKKTFLFCKPSATKLGHSKTVVFCCQREHSKHQLSLKDTSLLGLKGGSEAQSAAVTRAYGSLHNAALFCLVPGILALLAKNILISPYDCHTNYTLHQLGAFNGLHPVKRRAAFSHYRECQRRVQRGRWWRYKKARKEHIKQRKEADEPLNEGNQYKGGQ